MSSGSACWILWLTPMDWLALSIGRSGSQPLEYSFGIFSFITDVTKEFGILYQWKHACPRCGQQTLKIDEVEFIDYLKNKMLHCEECGTILDFKDFITGWHWD